MATLRVDLCPVWLVDQVWPKLQDGFRKSLSRTGGDISELDLRITARTGQGFLFVAYEGQDIRGASLWRTDNWASGQRFRCLACFGTGMKDWFDLMRTEVEKVAGDIPLVADGRNGWGEVIPGVKQLRAVYEVRR